MSDAINGGGGGGSDPMAMLQQILDPLGLFKGIGGGIDSILKGGGAEQVKQYGAVAMNNVGQYAQQGAGAGASSDPTATQYEPESEPKGYGQLLDSETNKAAQMREQIKQQQFNGGRKQDNSAMTATQSDQSATDSSAATASQNDGRMQDTSRMIGNPYELDYDTSKHPEAAKAEEIRHLQTVMAYFQQFDEQGMAPGDHKFDKANLANIIANPNASPEIKAAAHYLLTHPQILSELAAASGGGSGLITDGKVAERLMRLQGTFTAPTNSPVGQDPGADGKNPGGGVDKKQGGNGDKPIVPMGNKTPPVAEQMPVGRTLDESMDIVGQSMNDKEQALREAIASGDPNKVALAQLDYTKVQQCFQRMYDLIGNLGRAYHDMSMNSIGHIR